MASRIEHDAAPFGNGAAHDPRATAGMRVAVRSTLLLALLVCAAAATWWRLGNFTQQAACIAPFTGTASGAWHNMSTDAGWSIERIADSSDFIAHVGDSGTRRYDTALESPRFVVPAQGMLIEFRQRRAYSWANTMATLEIAIDDGPYLDIVTAGGRFEDGGYDGHSLPTNPLGFRAAWASAPDAETRTRVVLPAAAFGKSARLRFRLGSAGTGDVLPGWTLADLRCIAAP